MAIYTDVNSFSPETQPYLYDIAAVYQSLYNLFSTRQGDRLFNPTYGFDIEDRLFDLINNDTTLAIKQLVVGAIGLWEPRVLINNAETTITPDPDANSYNLVLTFNIQGISGQNFVYTTTFTQ